MFKWLLWKLSLWGDGEVLIFLTLTLLRVLDIPRQASQTESSREKEHGRGPPGLPVCLLCLRLSAGHAGNSDQQWAYIKKRPNQSCCLQDRDQEKAAEQKETCGQQPPNSRPKMLKNLSVAPPTPVKAKQRSQAFALPLTLGRVREGHSFYVLVTRVLSVLWGHCSSPQPSAMSVVPLGQYPHSFLAVRALHKWWSMDTQHGAWALPLTWQQRDCSAFPCQGDVTEN
jgi:hypothetical protein